MITNNNKIGFFSLNGRSNRMEYFKIYILIVLFGIINYFYFIPTAKDQYVSFYIITYCILYVLFLPITVRRLHDSNLSGICVFIEIVPSILSYINKIILVESNYFLSVIAFIIDIYYLYLTFRKGNDFKNKYGFSDSPKSYNNKTINKICILFILLIIISGILFSL